MEILQRILPLSSQCLQWSRHVNCRQLSGNRVTILSGGSDCKHVQSSLLFQAAVSGATEGHQVAFICRQPLSCLPVGVHGMPCPEARAMKTLKFIYLSTMAELLDYLAGIHEAAFLPSLIIVDALEKYIQPVEERGVQATTAMVCAFLIDTAQYISLHSDGFSQVLVSLEETPHSLLLPVCQKLVKSVCEIHREQKERSSILYRLQLSFSSRQAKNEHKELIFELIMNAETVKLKAVILEEVADIAH